MPRRRMIQGQTWGPLGPRGSKKCHSFGIGANSLLAGGFGEVGWEGDAWQWFGG